MLRSLRYHDLPMCSAYNRVVLQYVSDIDEITYLSSQVYYPVYKTAACAISPRPIFDPLQY